MAKYLIEEETLTNLADSARTITGETKQLSPAEMKEQLVIAEEAIDTQADLLTQLSTILDGKAGGGGSENEICEVTIIENIAGISVAAYSLTDWKIDSLGTIITDSAGLVYSLMVPFAGSIFTFSVPKNGTLVLHGKAGTLKNITGNGININYAITSSAGSVNPYTATVAIIQVLENGATVEIS